MRQPALRVIVARASVRLGKLWPRPPWLKRDSYKDYVVSEPVQYTGFKLFYHNDTKKGDPLMAPQDLLKLEPKPLYIQYQ